MEPINSSEKGQPPSTPGGPPRNHAGGVKGRGSVVGICLLLALAVFLVFGRILGHEFINYDDGEYFTANPIVLRGLTSQGVIWAFRTDCASNWHPLTWLSLMFDAELFGTGPVGPHFTNLLLHAANTVLLFLLLIRLTGGRWRSAFVAALFALHPLHVESVAWVAERKDVLSGLFFMLTLLMYARYAEWKSKGAGPGTAGNFSVHSLDLRPWSRDYVLALLFFALGLMSKPMLVTLPLVLLLLDYWPLRRFEHSSRWHLVREKLPFFALSIASSVVTVVVQKGAVQPLTHLTLGIRAVNAAVAYVRYLYKMFWPFNLAIPYPHHGYWPFWLLGLSAALLLGASLVAVRQGRRFPFLVTGWFWYVGMLVPVIGLVQVGMQSMADRYTYLPLIGVFIVLAWTGAELAERWRLPRAVAGSVALLLLAACATRTVDQLRFWRNSDTLFRHAVAVTRGNDVAWYNLGEYHFNRKQINEAIACYRNAVEIRSNYDDALNNLGVALAVKGNLDEAVVRIRQAIRCRPNKADAHYNLGNALVLQNQLDEAVVAYTEALRLRPDYPEAHNNLANVLFTQQHRDAAAQHYREALRLNPNHEGAQRGLRALGEPLP